MDNLNPPGVYFRPFRMADHKALARQADNIKIWKNVRDHFPHPYSRKDAISFITHCAGLEPCLNFAIIVDGEVAGSVGYVPGTDVERVSAEIGYWIGEEFWGRGIVTQVVKEFTDFVFRNTDIVHLFAGIFSHNKASMRVLEKSGYSFVGIMHRAAIKDNKLIDLHYYEKLKPQPRTVK